MAIYVYRTSDGALMSYCPNDTDQVAGASELTAQGFAALIGQAKLDATHAWDPPTHAVVIVVAKKSVPTPFVFWQRFTSTEREAIENLYATGTQAVKNAIGAFKQYISIASGVDCNDAYVQAKINQLETIGVIAAGRAAQILV